MNDNAYFGISFALSLKQ